MDKYERREKFLEQLLVLGTLLVVFLGFALPSESSVTQNTAQPQTLAQMIDALHFELVITFGIFFILMALVAYAILLFRGEIVRSPKLAVAIYLVCSAMMAILLSGLIIVGFVSGIVIKSSSPFTIDATIVGLVALLFAIFLFILRLLYLEESDFMAAQTHTASDSPSTARPELDRRLEKEMHDHLSRYVEIYDALTPKERGGLDLLEYTIVTRKGDENHIIDRNLLADYLSLKVAKTNNALQKWVAVFALASIFLAAIQVVKILGWVP